MIDSCVKSWQYFPTQITSLNSVSNWLSYDIVAKKEANDYETNTSNRTQISDGFYVGRATS